MFLSYGVRLKLCFLQRLACDYKTNFCLKIENTLLIADLQRRKIIRHPDAIRLENIETSKTFPRLFDHNEVQ
jgi:hypothetical protein